MKPNELPKLRWQDLSSVQRRYIVKDDQGRYGIASCDPVYHDGVLFVHPLEMPSIAGAGAVPGTETLPQGALIITSTAWHLREDGKYHGVWCDYRGIGPVRTLEIVADLGWIVPDWMVDRFASSLPSGDPEDAVINIRQAAEYCREVGEIVSSRGLRKACARGYVPGAKKIGRDWVLTYHGLNYYLDHRPRPGRKK